MPLKKYSRFNWRARRHAGGQQKAKDKIAEFHASRKKHFQDQQSGVYQGSKADAKAKDKPKPEKKLTYPVSKEDQYKSGQKSESASVREATKEGAKKAGIIPTKTVKTKGGDYDVFAKKSKKAQSFREAFREARRAGTGTFEWNDKKYSSALATDKKKKKKWIKDPEGSDMMYLNQTPEEQTKSHKEYFEKKKKKKVLKIN